jgi:ferric-dicitrate binding protein FerR (iron transport regulator)
VSRADELAVRYLDGAATPEETAELERLLAGDPAAADAFARAARRDHAFARLFGEASAEAPVLARLRAARRARRIRLAALAAAGLLVAVGLLSLRGNPGVLLRGPLVHRYPGETTTLVLRDGAEALVGGTPDAKEVELRAGELEADVAPQPTPMVLRTPQAEIRVLGTRFTVGVRGPQTRLEVAEGRVAFVRKADGAAIEVGAGRSARAFSKAGAPLRTVSAAEDRFLELRSAVMASGYFSPDGVPYHAIERLVIDAPDHGRLSTSEAMSFWLWMEACHGRVTQDWAPFRKAWSVLERAFIPGAEEQPVRPIHPALLGPEPPRIEDYPIELGEKAKADDLADELRRAYGTDALYAMHWLVDPDNESGFGRRGNRAAKEALLNTFQRGPEESVWETIPHPSWEDFASGGSGFLPLFVKQDKVPKQWRYVCAPDADARAVQAAYWAAAWAKPEARATLPLAAAARMGDALRYALRERGFRARHGLIGWSFGWGGSIEAADGWAWRLGASQVHVGYQNPVAAWALANSPDLRPRAAGAVSEWKESFDRQLDFLRSMQSDEGAFAGGGAVRPDGSLAFDPHPVFRDPPSNEWFGWQAWAADRLAQVQLLTSDPRARPILERWAAWAKRVVVLKPDGAWALPGRLVWTGRKVAVEGETQDVGVTAATARALATWAKASGDAASRELARELLDRLWRTFDGRGLAVPEARPDYRRLHDPVHYPGRPGTTFLDLRPTLKSDPDLPRVQSALRRGEAPVFRFHRFWAQAEAAVAYAEYARLFP